MTELTPVKYVDKVPSSVVHVPVQVSKSELERVLNREIPDVLYENMELQSDKGILLYIGAHRNGQIQIGFDSMQISYKVPISISIHQGSFLGGLQSTGELELHFISDWNITSNWELNTQTKLERFEWTQKPVLTLLGIDIPIRFIGDFALKRSRNVLVNAIDDQIKKTADLKNRVHEYWDWMKEPILVEEEYELWLQLEPEAFAMSPVTISDDHLHSEFWMKAITHITVGEKPDSLDLELPPFQMTEIQEAAFFVHLRTGISYQNMESQLQELATGQSFEVSGQEIIIESLSLYARNQKLQVIMNLEGDIKGKAFGEGVPVFDPATNELRIDIHGMDLKTRQFFWKHATKLMRNKIRKKIESFMHLQIRENLEDLEKVIASEIKDLKVNEYLSFEGELMEMDLTNCFLGEKGVQIVLSSSGKLNGKIRLDTTP